MTTYATVADLLARKRVNTVNDLANDDGVRQSRIDLLTNPAITTALADASGAVDAAMLAGKLYTSAQLEAFTGNSLSHLKRITCDVAWAYMLERNPTDPDEADKYRQLATTHLERLKAGDDVFGAATANINASTPTIDGPSAVDYERMNLIPERTRNFYPSRSSRLPSDRR